MGQANDREEARCAEARKIRAIDAAFRAGDLDALRAAVDDPSVVPNGPMPLSIGPCLQYAIYHSPLRFVRQLLEIGADPNARSDDGFPAVIAAITCGRSEPGFAAREDVEELIRLLLEFRADPNQRGINDYTALHVAVGERNSLAVQLLLDAGADPDLRTRIDDYETPLELAQRAGLRDIADLIAAKRIPVRRRLRSGLELLVDVPGSGEPLRRQHNYLIRLRIWLNKGDPIRWKHPSGFVTNARLEDDGTTLVTEVRLDRRSLVAGLFYGAQGMRVGGMRRLQIAPHLAYGDQGVPDVIPPRAVLTAELTFLEAIVR